MLENSNNPNNAFVRYQYAETRLEPIWTSLVEILRNPANVIPRLEEYTFKSPTVKNSQEKITQAEQQIESVTKQRARIVQAYIDGGIIEKDYKEQLELCRQRMIEYQKEKVKHQQVLMKREERKDRNEILNNLYEKIRDRLENPTYEDKYYILHLFIDRINLFHKSNYAEVFFRFPASINIKQDELINVVSQPNDVHLVLHIKTLSEKERQRDLLVNNPKMFLANKSK